MGWWLYDVARNEYLCPASENEVKEWERSKGALQKRCIGMAVKITVKLVDRGDWHRKNPPRKS